MSTSEISELAFQRAAAHAAEGRGRGADALALTSDLCASLRAEARS